MTNKERKALLTRLNNEYLPSYYNYNVKSQSLWVYICVEDKEYALKLSTKDNLYSKVKELPANLIDGINVYWTTQNGNNRYNDKRSDAITIITQEEYQNLKKAYLSKFEEVTYRLLDI